ncbi:MAG: PHP domain-containing protein [Chloroflexota bacterium]|nr:PHP domain-containing protein [Chloroflexota bacterium]
MTVFDLHLHTVHGSSDSNLRPEQLIEEAQRIGLDGICLTEHSGGWENYQLIDTFKDSGLVVIGAVEVYTDVGHVIAIGIRHYVSGMHTAEGLRKVLDKAGGVMIPAHPFRNFFNRPPYNVNLLYKNYDGDLPTTAAEAANHPLFELADDIEIANGSNTDKENLFTLEVARELGFTGTGGSDAHSTQGIGKCVTIFDGDIRNEADLIEALKAKAFTAGQGMHVGNLEPFGERSVQEATV